MPSSRSQAFTPAVRPLSALTVGELGEVLRLDGDGATLAFLAAEGLRPGVQVTPLAIGGAGAMLLQVGDNRLNLAKTITDKISIAV